MKIHHASSIRPYFFNYLRMKTNCLLFGICLILVSCNRGNKNIEEYFKNMPNHHPAVDLVDIEGAIFGMPLEIAMSDTLLVAKDDIGNKYFTLIDIKNNRLVNRFGDKGKGPDEFMYPSNISINRFDNILEFTTSNPIAHNRFSLNGAAKNSPLTSSKKRVFSFKDDSPSYITWFPALNCYIANGMFLAGKYAIINEYDTITKVFGDLPPSKYREEIDNFLLCDAYQGFIKSRPDGKKVAQVSLRCDLIDVINADGTIIRFQTYNPEIAVIDGMVAISRESPYGFSSMATTDKYIYALYSGRTFNEYAMSALLCEKIYVFNWDLQPVCSYTLSTEAISIAVNSDDSKLYFMGMGDIQMGLYKIELSH